MTEIPSDQLIQNVHQARQVLALIRYYDWTFDTDDEPNGYGPTSILWVKRVEDDSTDPTGRRQVKLTNSMTLRFPMTVAELLMLVWATIRLAEDHERLERLVCCADGLPVFATHDHPDTQPPAGLAMLTPDPATLHLRT